jgi:hypothetical protein
MFVESGGFSGIAISLQNIPLGNPVDAVPCLACIILLSFVMGKIPVGGMIE